MRRSLLLSRPLALLSIPLLALHHHSPLNSSPFPSCDTSIPSSINPRPVAFPDVISSSSFVIQKILNSKPVIDQLYAEHLTKHHIPSIIYGIVYDGELIYTSSFGSTVPQTVNSTNNSLNSSSMSLNEGKASSSTISPTPNSYYRIASMSKSFTAMAILQLRDRGLLKLHEPASIYFPELAKLSSLPDSSTLTIWHLLTMQSGYPQDDPWADRLLHQSREDFNALILSKFCSSNPIGIQFEYSNLNYAILGEIITRVSGIPYQQYIIDNICKPLQMHDTVFNYEDSSISSNKIVYGYRWEEDQWKPEPYLGDGVFGAMGGVITTMNDFAKYAAYHQSGWPLEYVEQKVEDAANNKPLSVRSLREMHQQYTFAEIWNSPPPSQSTQHSPTSPSTPASSYTTCGGYGLGLVVWHDTRGVKTVRHAGGLPGMRTSLPLPIFRLWE